MGSPSPGGFLYPDVQVSGGQQTLAGREVSCRCWGGLTPQAELPVSPLLSRQGGQRAGLALGPGVLVNAFQQQ